MPKLPITVRAAAALPAAGAFDPAPAAIAVGGYSFADIHVLYTTNAGSVVGRPKFRVQLSFDAAATLPASVGHWEDDVTLDPTTLAKAAGWWSMEGGGQEVRLPTPGVAATERGFRLANLDLGGATWMRVACAEHGDAALPGTMAVTAVLHGEV